MTDLWEHVHVNWNPKTFIVCAEAHPDPSILKNTSTQTDETEQINNSTQTSEDKKYVSTSTQTDSEKIDTSSICDLLSNHMSISQTRQYIRFRNLMIRSHMAARFMPETKPNEKESSPNRNSTKFSSWCGIAFPTEINHDKTLSS